MSPTSPSVRSEASRTRSVLGPGRPSSSVTLFGAGLLILAAVVLASPSAWAQGFDLEQAEMRLLADQTAYEPGTVARIAAEVMVVPGWHVNSHWPSAEYLIPTELDVTLPPGVAPPEIRYPEHELQSFSFSPDEPVAVYDGTFHIFVDLLIPDDASGELPLSAELTYQACDDKSCAPPTTAAAELDLRIGSGGQAQHGRVFGTGAEAGAASAGELATDGPGKSLALVLLLGLIGGFILNAMPCVLPVLSLKVFSLMKAAHQGRSHLVSGALATTAGILVSFWALALAAILAARAGAAVGWGIQFQQPGFVTFLAVVVVLFSLNMWGLFEIPLPQKLALMGSGGAREGLAGHFAAGLFATLMATPCSAPFLGTAVGFALAQPPLQIFLVFTAIGLGLALPYLALAVAPRLAGLLPKPGAWMDTFRQVLGFLLAAAAVWLFYVLSAQISSERLAFVQLSLLAMALAVWAMGRLRGKPLAHRVAMLTVAIFCASTVVLAVGAPARTAGDGGGVEATELLAWRPFDEAEAVELAKSGTPVFVDFTADWCLTCKANERAVIETEATAALFRDHGVVVMKGDWTNRDDVITEFLARHGRAAVPFYILYRPGGDTHVFGEVLTRGAIAQALGASAS